jgi:hypothetical protein
MGIEQQIEQIRRLAASRDPHDRLEALKQIEGLQPPEPKLFDIAKGLIGDRADNNVRWQACIVVGNYIQAMPERVWEAICKYGRSRDDDLRAAISTCLLEHLLNAHFEKYFPKCKKLVERSRYFANTLSTATVMSDDKLERVQRFLRSRAKRSP